MSVLLRHPATVPALFSRSVEPDRPAERSPASWARFSHRAPVFWATVVLIDVPLVKAATAAVGLVLPH